jgi:hypothetical protein
MVKAGVSKPRPAKNPKDPNKEVERKMDETTHLIDKQDIAEISSKKSKPSKGCTVDEKLISKMLRGNFKGWGPELTCQLFRDGMSLRQRLTQGKHDLLTGKRTEPMGKLYYAELRTAYGSVQSPEHLLSMLNDGAPDDGHLQAALEAVFSRKRNLEPLTAYLSTAAVFNQKNTVALLKAILLLNPSTSLGNNCLALGVLEYCTRHALQTKYPREMGVMKN